MSKKHSREPSCSLNKHEKTPQKNYHSPSKYNKVHEANILLDLCQFYTSEVTLLPILDT